MRFINYLICLQILTISLSAENIPEYLLDENYKPQFETKFKAGNPNCNHLHEHFKGDKLLSGRPEGSQIEYRSYDVLKYDLYLDWYDLMAKNGEGKELFKAYTGVVKIELKIDSLDTEFIELDAGDFYINSMSFDGYVYDEVPQPESGKLVIPVPVDEWGPSTGGILEISYTYTGNGRKGMYIYPKGYSTYDWNLEDTLVNHHNVAYTQGEPNDARYWFPCNDSPHDKAEYEISISVPKGYSAPSNGRLESIDESGDTLTFNWVGKYPISTYLMVAHASKYELSTDYFNRSETDSIPIMNYIWVEDDNDTSGIFEGFEVFKNTAQMLDLFSGLFVEYPYEKYGHAAVYPYDFGGMEHTTMTTVHRNWIMGDSENGIAHEAAHQWIGDMITCATWKDLWINEGGASWCEALWAEEIGGDSWHYSQNMYGQLWWYFYASEDTPELANHPIYDVNEEDLFGGASFLIYSKAAWIYHMLYEWSGREAFLGAMKRLFTDYYFQAVETADFERIMKEELTDFPVPIETFFDQYVYGGGHPKFNINTIVSAEHDGKYTVSVTLEQTQSGELVNEIFEVPLQLIFAYNMDTDDETLVYSDTFNVSEKITEKTFEFDFIPEIVGIDRSKLLCESVNSLITSVEDISVVNPNISVYPNPASSGEEVNVVYSAANSGIANLDVFDSQGNKLFELQNNTVMQGKNMMNIPTSNLNSGIYFGRIYTGSSVTNFKFSIVK